MATSKRMKELESKLQPRQVKAAYLLVENELADGIERRTLEEISEQIGVVYKTLWMWQTQNQAFIEYKNAIADDFLADKRDRVYGQLMKLINAPNPSVKAISLYLQRHGLLTQKTQIETINASDERDAKSIEADLADIDALLNSSNDED